MEFGSQQQVLIQPYENDGGFHLSDQQKAKMQNKPTSSISGGSGIEGAIGNAIGGLFK